MSTANVTTWNDDMRRNGSYVVLGLALALVLVGVALWQFVDATPEWVFWALVGVMVLVLVFMAVLLFVPARTAAPAEAIPDPAPMAEHGGAYSAAAPSEAPAPAFEPRVLTLRCGDCGTIFEVTDTGERPLYHTCPGCGAEGALRDEPVAEAPVAPAPAQTEPLPTPEPVAAAAPPPAAVKRIKLRCGGCKEVFTIDDTGERPLKRACPHCGRVGQIS